MKQSTPDKERKQPAGSVRKRPPARTAKSRTQPANRPSKVVPPVSSAAAPQAAPMISRRPPRSALTWPLRVLWGQRLRFLNLLLIVVALLIALSQGFRMSTESVRFDDNASTIKSIPHQDVALVFGAGVLPNGQPTEYLKHRVETAVDLYKAERVDAILMSGDNSSSHYNEPTVMKAYAVRLGADPSDVIIDYAGFNTYDTCYRAVKIFGQKSVTVVTQGYHLPRAIMTCRNLGLNTIGVAAKHTSRDWTVSYLIREHMSTAKSAIQMMTKPQPTVLGKVETP
jgi:vancomycin permeability regulator SanA